MNRTLFLRAFPAGGLVVPPFFGRRVPGSRDAALAGFEAAIAADTGLAEAHSDYSVALYKTGNHAAAEAACRKSVQLRPLEVRYRLRLAELLELANRPRESLDELAMALECAPDRLDLLARLTKGQERLGLYAGMLRTAERAILDNGENFENLLALAAARFHTMDIQGSMESARKALALSPDRHEAHMVLGSALFEQGRVERHVVLPDDVKSTFLQYTPPWRL